MKIMNLLSPSATLLGIAVLTVLCNHAEAQGIFGGFDPLHKVTNFLKNATDSVLSKFKVPSNPDLITKLFDNPDLKFDAKKAFGLSNLEIPNFGILKQLTGLDIDEITKIDRKQLFSPFNPFHQAVARVLTGAFMKLPDIRLLLILSAAIRDRVNPGLFTYCLSVACLHREDTQNVKLPSLVSTMPQKFIHRNTLRALGDQSRLVGGTEAGRCLVQAQTSKVTDEEHALNYFREDIGLNLHHWYWHLIYPSDPPLGQYKDRRGELFYYMHSQMIRRYNFERFSHGMKKCVPLPVEKGRIAEAYFPGIDASPDVPFADRGKDTLFTDFKINDQTITIASMQQNVKNIQDAIRTKTFRSAEGKTTRPSDYEFCDVLGNVIEASEKTIDKKNYGNLHTYGHMMIGSSHDPEKKYTTTQGVMLDFATAVRDPAFHRWHTMIDNLVDSHKRTLAPYTSDQLGFDGVEIKFVKVESKKDKDVVQNEFLTSMTDSFIDVQNATDSDPSKKIRVCYQHVEHQPFTYTLELKSDRKVTGLVRILLAPTFNQDTGKDFDFDSQRNMFVKLDSFLVSLNPGSSTITRRSVDSSITVPTDQTFQRVGFKTKAGEEKTDKLAYSGCGWPEYMLIPRGTTQGLAAKLFVTVTDWEDDKVEGNTMSEDDKRASHVLCGVRNGKYPYKRPMGYPFDRVAESRVKTVEDFVKNRKNMFVVDTKIRFSE